MILISLALLGFAVADLLRWSPEPAAPIRAWLAILGATGVNVVVAGLSGLQAVDVAVIALISVTVLVVWLRFDQQPYRDWGAGYPLAWILMVLVVSFALSGVVDDISGPLAHWYSNLAFPFVQTVAIDQFLLGVAGGLFLLSAANRVVRLVLTAAGTPIAKGESTLRGGRLLGPMERLVVGAVLLAGDPAGAALVIAAKGLLRLPEIRNSAERHEDDQVTEYFLIGTFSSLLLAAGVAALVSGAG